MWWGTSTQNDGHDIVTVKQFQTVLLCYLDVGTTTPL